MPRRPVLPRSSPLRRRLLRLYDRLARRYGPQGWWPARSAFEVVVGAVLAQNAAWSSASGALARLRAARALDPEAMAALAPSRLAALLRPSGTYRVKARRLRALLRRIMRRPGGLERFLRLPALALRAELLTVPGVGPETADTIALYAAGRPVFVAGAYTRRILARHRLVSPEADYASVQALFMDHLPRDPGLYNEYHALLVRVAKEHCRARPRCEGCPLRSDLGGRPPREVPLPTRPGRPRSGPRRS